MAKANLTAQLVREILDYSPGTGVFTWKIKPRAKSDVGDIAGCVNSDGYIQIGYKGSRYVAHRLVWMYMHGKWPDCQIDHINGQRTDNRLCNLRDVSASINQQNRRAAQRNSTSGFAGVRRLQNLWRAGIWVNGKSVFLGYYRTAADAHTAYIEAKRVLHDGCTL